MITVRIDRKNGHVNGFKISGHAQFAEHGQDIVCAGVSAVSTGSVNAIVKLCGIKPKCKIKDGFLSCSFPSDLSDEKDARVQLIVESMIVSLRSIEEAYGEYIIIND
ncbi:MAG: ribosomal-processing cysteine protease Prp [Bacilli bacterium]